VAEVGAISRIGQIISFLGFGLSLFVLPHLASLREGRAFSRSDVIIWFILCGVASVALLAITASKGAIVVLLGPNYVNL